MAKTFAMPAESIIAIGKNGDIEITHIRMVEVEINEHSVRAFLQLKGTTPEEVIEAAIEDSRRKQKKKAMI